MERLSITQLKRAAASGRLDAVLHVQVEAITQKETRDQKPYYEIVFADAEAKMTLRAWSDSPVFEVCTGLRRGTFVEIKGNFALNGGFGLDAKYWECAPLGDQDREALLAGPEELREKQRADFDFILQTVGTMVDPRLRSLTELFLKDFGTRFRRTAAARTYHHARRGGLVEHTAQMMRTGCLICELYPQLNRDLLLAGILLHDSGKLWENSLPENGFSMPYNEAGELLGHINIGIELINALWRKLDLTPWTGLEPDSEDVRLHLLHLIASHHGEPAFGSPVVPKTPEAHALHHIDNLDAKLEMVFAGYQTAAPLGPRIFERVRPLSGNLVQPLPKFGGPTPSLQTDAGEDSTST